VLHKIPSPSFFAEMTHSNLFDEPMTSGSSKERNMSRFRPLKIISDRYEMKLDQKYTRKFLI
jgi:hypothetical protein